MLRQKTNYAYSDFRYFIKYQIIHIEADYNFNNVIRLKTDAISSSNDNTP